MAIKNFKNTATSDIAQGKNTKDARTIEQGVWKVARRKLDLLNGISALSELQGEGNKLHALTDKPGYHSLRVGNKYRIVFKFEDGHVQDVEITDYH